MGDAIQAITYLRCDTVILSKQKKMKVFTLAAFLYKA